MRQQRSCVIFWMSEQLKLCWFRLMQSAKASWLFWTSEKGLRQVLTLCKMLMETLRAVWVSGGLGEMYLLFKMLALKSESLLVVLTSKRLLLLFWSSETLLDFLKSEGVFLMFCNRRVSWMS